MISIITPIYNSEKYLDSFLQSLLRQTYKDFELLLINDCSTDNSLKICNEYAKKDNRIKVFSNEKNSGISKTRNFGLTKIKGEYVIFSDDDDYWPEDALEKLMEISKKYNADIAIGGFYVVYDNKAVRKKFITAKKVYTKESALKHYLNYKTIYGYPWGKLFKKETLKNLKFSEEVSLGEDAIFSFDALMNANMVAFTKEPVYYYRKRNDSYSLHGSDINKREIGSLAQLEYVKKFINIPIVKKNYNIYAFELNYQIYIKYKRSSIDAQKKFFSDYKKIKSTLDDNWKYVLFYSINLRLKIHAIKYFCKEKK